jgi:hypothetical protein
MTQTRDQLVAEWQEQLAQAQSAKPDSPRVAWLQRTQVRLFRFMLANYGHQRWRPQGGDSLPNEKAAVQPAAETIVPAAAELGGKPARSDGEIRLVLTAVADAQEPAAHQPGPLAAGLDPDSWVIVAAASSKLKIGRCCELLRVAGLRARTAYRGDDHMLEVPARERQQAFAIIEENRRRIHAPPGTPRTQPIPLWCRFAAVAIISTWVTGVLAVMTLGLIWTMGLPGQTKTLSELLDMSELYPIWGSLYVAMLLLFSLGMIRRSRPIPAAGRGRKR